MAEADFDFGRVNVDVDFFVRHFQEEQKHRKGRGRNNVSVGFADGVKQEAIAHEAAIHENVNAIAIRALNLRA